LKDVVDVLKAHSIEHAATGLAGAWAWDAVDDFHLVTLYLREPPSPELLDTLQADHKLSFQARDTDANLWFVSPQDDGVFQGAIEKKGVHTVAPLQVYLDLAAHQESTDSAREILRSQILPIRREWQEWSESVIKNIGRPDSGEFHFARPCSPCPKFSFPWGVGTASRKPGAQKDPNPA
jgi:hypothetical protein